MTEQGGNSAEMDTAGGSARTASERQEGTPSSETGGSAAVFEELNRGAVSALARQGGRSWTPQERELLDTWMARVKAAQHAHYSLMGQLERANIQLGIPIVIITAIVGTSAFATLAGSDQVPTWARALVGVASVSTSILAAIQTFLRFAQRSQRHGLAADWFSAVRRDIEVLRSIPDVERGAPKEVLDGLRKEINRVVQHAPRIGEPVWHKFAEKYGVKEPLEA